MVRSRRPGGSFDRDDDPRPLRNSPGEVHDGRFAQGSKEPGQNSGSVLHHPGFVGLADVLPAGVVRLGRLFL
jgi:hypothetical protein